MGGCRYLPGILGALDTWVERKVHTATVLEMSHGCKVNTHGNMSIDIEFR